MTIPIESIAHAAVEIVRLANQSEVLRLKAPRRELLKRVSSIAALYCEEQLPNFRIRLLPQPAFGRDWRLAVAYRRGRGKDAKTTVLDFRPADNGAQLIAVQHTHRGRGFVSRVLRLLGGDLILMRYL